MRNRALDRPRRVLLTLTCGLALLVAPSAARAQGSAAGAGTGASTGLGGTAGTAPSIGTAATAAPAQGTTDVSALPACGQPAQRTRGAKRRATRRRSARRKGAVARREAASAREQPLRATLTLDQEDQETVTAAAFGRSTDAQRLTLVYRVSGCRISEDLPLPRNPLPTGPVRAAGARPLPFGAVQIEDVDTYANRYVVHLRVFVSSNKAEEQGGIGKSTTVSSPTPGEGQASATPVTTPGTAANGTTTTGASAAAGIGTPAAGASPGEFDLDTGSYTSFVRLKADWMQTIATPVSVSRSEDTEIIPLLIGMGGGLSGFLLFTLLRRIHNDDLLVKEPWVLWLAGTVSVVVGAGTAFFTNYYNQDVWTVDANGLALFTAAVSASTAGVAAGLLTGIYNTSAAERAEDRRAADQAATPKRS